MDTLRAIFDRYTCRDFSDKKINQDDLSKIANAGVSSPSAMNKQGWQVIVVTNQELIQSMDLEALKVIASMPDKSYYNRIQSRGGKLFYNAQAMIFVANVKESEHAMTKVDLGIVAQNIVLAATALGIDSCHCGSARFVFGTQKANEFRKSLKVQDDYDCEYAILLGVGNTKGEPHVIDTNKIVFID